MLPVPWESLKQQQLLLRVGLFLRIRIGHTWRPWFWNSSATTSPGCWEGLKHQPHSGKWIGQQNSLVTESWSTLWNSSSAPISHLTQGYGNSPSDYSHSRKTCHTPLKSSNRQLGYILIAIFVANVMHPFRQIGAFFPYLSVVCLRT